MPIDMPPNYDVSTQLKNGIELVSPMSTTQTINHFNYNDGKIFDIKPLLNYSTATRIDILSDNILTYSTWLESNTEDFDLVSKLTYAKRFRVKSKVKMISRYTPKIIID